MIAFLPAGFPDVGGRFSITLPIITFRSEGRGEKLSKPNGLRWNPIRTRSDNVAFFFAALYGGSMLSFGIQRDHQLTSGYALT